MAKSKIERFVESVPKQVTGMKGPKTTGTQVAQLASLTKVPPKTPSITPKNPSYGSLDQKTSAIKEILEGYACGKTRRTLSKELVNAGYSESSAEKLLCQVSQDLSKQVEKLKPTLVSKNIATLEHIIETTISSRDFRTALTAITELNKVLHAYEPTIEVKIENNFGFDFGLPTTTEIQTPITEIDPETDEH